MEKPKGLSKYQVSEVLEYLDNETENSKEISEAMNIRIMQVAGVKKWRTMGKY